MLVIGTCIASPDLLKVTCGHQIAVLMKTIVPWSLFFQSSSEVCAREMKLIFFFARLVLKYCCKMLRE
jgi:hypothetical protein